MEKSPENRPVVSIIVANWNGAGMLPRCLSSLQISARRAGHPFEILVIDDASSDESVGMVREQFPRVRLATNPRNIGFARTINRGARMARGRVLLLANNDLAVRDDFVAEIVKWFLPDAPPRPEGAPRGPLFGISAKTVGWYDGKPNQLCMGAVWQGGRITPAWQETPGAAPCLFVQAGAAAYDTALFRKLGGLATFYEPGYWEDYDLSWRAARRGWAQLYDPAAFALHMGGGSMRRRYGDDAVEAMKARNHLLFEAANLRSPRLLAEWSARLALNLARDTSRGGRRPLMRATAEATERLAQAFRARLFDGGHVSDLSLLAPWREFEPSYS